MMTVSENGCGQVPAGRWSVLFAWGLVLVMALIPWSTSALAAQNPVMGSVTAVGAVQLRGVPLSSEGTLFGGDSIQTSGESYVRVRLTDGPQLELGTDTDVQVDRRDAMVQIAMRRGSMAFSSPESSLPVAVSIESLLIRAPEGAAAEVAFLAPNRLSVTALAESLMLTGAPGQQDAPVAEGEQVIIDLDAAVESTDPPPQTPGTATGAESGAGSSTKVIAISAGAAAGAGAVIFLATREKDSASQSQP